MKKDALVTYRFSLIVIALVAGFISGWLVNEYRQTKEMERKEVKGQLETFGEVGDIPSRGQELVDTGIIMPTHYGNKEKPFYWQISVQDQGDPPRYLRFKTLEDGKEWHEVEWSVPKSEFYSRTHKRKDMNKEARSHLDNLYSQLKERREARY